MHVHMHLHTPGRMPSGQASRRVHKGLVSGRPLLAELAGSPPWQDWQMQQALLDALVGMSAFKVRKSAAGEQAHS